MRCATRSQPRRGFTLVELLLAMVVAALLAGTALMAMWGAQEEARASRTRSQIARINQLLLEQWHGYTTANLPMTPTVTPPGVAGRDKMLIRLMLLRDTMRMEMPDRMTDLMTPQEMSKTIPAGTGGKLSFSWASQSWTLASHPRLWRHYRRRLEALIGRDPGAPSSDPNPYPDFSQWSPEFQGAECLYLIVASSRDSQSNGLDFFQPAEIGDFDADGVPEIHDGWGRPISFLRWAPGFVSDLQPGMPAVVAMTPSDPTEPPGYDPDHLDPLKVDPRWSSTSAPFRPFLLVPLIYSAGADGEYGIVTDNGTMGTFCYLQHMDDPYTTLDDNSSFIGDLIPGAVWTTGGHHAEDNITNHLIEVR